MKTAIITGINGQDGFYLTRLLLEKGYRVVGVQRRTSTSTSWRLDDLPDKSNLVLEPGDVTDHASMVSIVKMWQPDEFYNLAAQSQVWHSFKTPISTCDITGLGALVCLDVVRQEAPGCRLYQAGSSEQFGNVAATFGTERFPPEPGQARSKMLNMQSPMYPRSPYGAAKLFAHNMVRNYREAYHMFAVGGILFNHESPYRGKEFVTRKITAGIASVLSGDEEQLTLGNLDARRDWGHAEDYMRAAWMMLQTDKPKDYMIATGQAHSIHQFLTLAFLCVGVEDWSDLVESDSKLMRPSEIDVLVGDSSQARAELGWEPTHTFVDLVYSMMREDCRRYDVMSQLRTQAEVQHMWKGGAIQASQ